MRLKKKIIELEDKIVKLENKVEVLTFIKNYGVDGVNKSRECQFGFNYIVISCLNLSKTKVLKFSFGERGYECYRINNRGNYIEIYSYYPSAYYDRPDTLEIVLEVKESKLVQVDVDLYKKAFCR